MIIVKSPLRISLFGGSTDYKSFYSEHGSFLIGTTIDKHVYLSMRHRAKILSNESVITYSRSDIVKTWDEIQNPLIRETLKYKQLNHAIDFNSFSDIPSRTGLGGSSAFCVGLLYLINKLQGIFQEKSNLVKDAITIEREILKEAGGIQDQIWPAYGGFNSIEVSTKGKFNVKPLPITPEFKSELENSMLLIYTNNQRDQDSIAKSHDVPTNKEEILQIAHEAYSLFIKEDIESIGKLLHASWEQKKEISMLISTPQINDIVNTCLSLGAYGAKLLGSGGCGFVLVICNPIAKKKIEERFGSANMDFKFESNGVTEIFMA